MLSNEKVEVYILCGFLGCGKSTLLTRLIQYEQQLGRKIGVIMNEMGDVSIDSSFIPNDLPVMEMLGGCICCSLQGDLSSQIDRLMLDYRLDAIYIESTGAAEPFEILDACTDPSIAGKIQIRSLVTVADAKLWSRLNTLQSEIKELLETQVKYADIILLNKIDTLPEGDRKTETLIESIRTLNPNCLILSAVHTNIDLSIIGSYHRTHTAPAGVHRKTHVHHDLHLHSFTFPPTKPLSRRAFEEWLDGYSTELQRAKGYIRFTGEDGLFLFQYSNDQTIFTRFLIEPGSDPVLVFIGQGLDSKKMKSELLHLQNHATFSN